MRLVRLTLILLASTLPMGAQRPANPTTTLHVEIAVQSWGYDAPGSNWVIPHGSRVGYVPDDESYGPLVSKNFTLRQGGRKYPITLTQLPKSTHDKDASRLQEPADETHLLLVLSAGNSATGQLAVVDHRLKQMFDRGWAVSVVELGTAPTPYAHSEAELQQALNAPQKPGSLPDAIDELQTFSGRRLLVLAGMLNKASYTAMQKGTASVYTNGNLVLDREMQRTLADQQKYYELSATVPLNAISQNAIPPLHLAMHALPDSFHAKLTAYTVDDRNRRNDVSQFLSIDNTKP
jgi:hypothetical protein